MGNFGMLPSDILLDIFSRLPTESVLECKSVSKRWNTVLQTPSFAQLHFNHPNNFDSGKYAFVFSMDDEVTGSKQLHYVECDENETPSCRVKKMIFKPPFQWYRLIGSCNGLICLNAFPDHYTLDETDRASYVAYICNPITRESVMLPELKRGSRWDDPVDFFVIGFGYVPSTDEYKVVRMYKFRRDRREPEFAKIEVYTLGSGKGWRNEGKKIHIGSEKPCQHGVFANGCIHWDVGEGKIVVFDLADEMFVGSCVLSEFRCRNVELGVLGEYLCAYNCTNGYISSGWLLEKKKGETLMSCKEFSLTNMDGYDIPVAVISSGTLLCLSLNKLFDIYDLKSSSSQMLVGFVRSYCEARPHKNTLVSMKGLVERP